MASRSCPQLLGHLHICHVWAPNASVPPTPLLSLTHANTCARAHTHAYMHTHTHLQPPWLHSAGTHDSSAASLVKRSSGQLTSRELEGLHFPSTPQQSPLSSSPTAHTCRAQTPPRSTHPTAVCLSLLSSSSSAPGQDSAGRVPPHIRHGSECWDAEIKASAIGGRCPGEGEWGCVHLFAGGWLLESRRDTSFIHHRASPGRSRVNAE